MVRQNVPQGSRAAALALLVGAALIAPALAPVVARAGAAGGTEMKAEEIRRQLIGQTIRWWDEAGFFHGWMELEPDGRASITMQNPDGADTGQWRLADAQLCTRWTAARDGTEKCYRLRQVAPQRFVTSGGNVFMLVTPEV